MEKLKGLLKNKKVVTGLVVAIASIVGYNLPPEALAFITDFISSNVE